MTPKVEQLIEYNIADVAKIIAEERHCSAAEALADLLCHRDVTVVIQLAGVDILLERVGADR